MHLAFELNRMIPVQFLGKNGDIMLEYYLICFDSFNPASMAAFCPRIDRHHVVDDDG